jgi:hypothetical protein
MMVLLFLLEKCVSCYEALNARQIDVRGTLCERQFVVGVWRGGACCLVLTDHTIRRHHIRQQVSRQHSPPWPVHIILLACYASFK